MKLSKLTLALNMAVVAYKNKEELVQVVTDFINSKMYEPKEVVQTESKSVLVTNQETTKPEVLASVHNILDKLDMDNSVNKMIVEQYQSDFENGVPFEDAHWTKMARINLDCSFKDDVAEKYKGKAQFVFTPVDEVFQPNKNGTDHYGIYLLSNDDGKVIDDILEEGYNPHAVSSAVHCLKIGMSVYGLSKVNY